MKKEEAQGLGEDTGNAQSEPENRNSIGVITTVKFKVRGWGSNFLNGIMINRMWG